MTSTPSQTPSSSPVPDIILSFSFTIGGAAGGSVSVTAANVLAPQVQQAILQAFAALLGLPASVVRISNVTDLATGAVTAASYRRRLAVSGSLGVSVTLAANLGKVVLQSRVVAMQAALGGANGTAALVGVTQALAQSLGKPASAFAAAPGPAPTGLPGMCP